MANSTVEKKRPPHKRSRLLVPLLCLAGTLLLLASVYGVNLLLTPEILTDDQILRKTNWTEEELITVTSRRLQSKRRQESKREVSMRLQEQIAKLPAPRQEAVREAIMRETVAGALREFRLLTEEKKEDLVKRLAEQARRRKDEIGRGKPKIPAEEAAKDAERRKENGARAMRQILDQMTPDERKQFSPLIQEWVKTAETF